MESLEPAQLDIESVEGMEALLARRTAELREARARLQAVSQQLEQERQSRNGFLSMLAHELRNPLASLRSGFSLLQRAGARGDGNADGGAALAAQVQPLIERQLSHLARLLEEVSDLARARDGSLALRRDRFALQAAAEVAIAVAQPYLGAQDQQLRLDPGPAEAWVLGDRTRLAQALADLLIEASRRLPSGARVHLATRVVAGQAVAGLFESGADATEDWLLALLQPPPREREPLHVAGIGASLAGHLVELHGGRVWARRATDGGGGLIVAELPLAPN
ncbi:sensor histidine kinase [Azohydromonas aeria]|uniref:sensor histidine kinase n=1 Tax=Azohydromonas aeria TaxID=2590212 RepID=UPI0012FA0E40|nr:HAMP domain-containing sensor histidine kinase [Azohydromonas aeria]